MTRSLPTRYVRWMLVLAALMAAGIAGFGILNTRQMIQAQEESWRLTMQTQLDGVAEQASRWLLDREDGVRAAASFEPIVALYARLRGLSATGSSDLGIQARAEIRTYLSTSLNRNGIVGYLLATRDGQVLADSASLTGQRLDTPLEQDLLRRSLSGPRYAQITLPLHWPRSAAFKPELPVIVASAAVWPRGPELEPGVLFFIIDPRMHFDDIFLRARIGRSGETYAVTPDGRFATPSRFDPGSRDRGLRVVERLPNVAAAPPSTAGRDAAEPLTRAAAEIAAGRSGGNLEGYLDYRGMDVIGLWRWNAERRFGVVTEVDVAEALAPVRRQWTLSIAAGVLMLALVAALLALFASSRRRASADAALLQERERRIAEQLSFRSALLEAIPNPVFVRGPDTRLLDCNRAYEEAYGVRKQDLVGTRVGDLAFLDAQARADHQADAEWLIAQGGQRRSEQVEAWADGRHRTVLYQRQAFDLPDGRRGGMIGLLTDVSALKHAEDAARRGQDLLRRLLDAFPGYAVMTDKQLRYVFVNPAMAASYGVTPAEMVGRPIADFLSPSRWAIYRDMVQSAPGTRHIEERIEPSAGGRRRRFLEVTAIIGPTAEDGSGVDFAFGIDVTHARRGADYERFRSRVLEMITRQSPRAQILDTLVDEIHQMAPGTCSAILTIPVGPLTPEVGGLRSMPAVWFEVLARELADPARAELPRAQTLASDLRAEVPDHPLARAAAQAGWGCCWCEPITGSDGQMLGLLAVHYEQAVTPDRLDLYLLTEVAQLAGLALERDHNTHRLRAQEAELVESRRQLQVTFDTMQDGFLRIGPDGIINRVNQAMARILGYDEPSELVGLPISMLYVRDEDREWVRDQMATVGRLDAYRCQARHRDGRLIWVAFTGHRVHAADGSVLGNEGVVRDITGQIEFEKALESARDAAQAAAEAKSTFLANMSHEIRTPMNAIIGLTELALRTSLTPRQADYLGKVHGAAQNLLGLLNGILDLSKIESGKLTLESVDFDLNSVLDGVANLMAVPLEAKGLELLFSRGPGVPTRLIGDPLRLGQVMTNLVSNACKFTERGQIVVATSLVSQPGPQVRLRFDVHDSGIGMTPEQVRRLFQPFSQADESTTRRFGGTGLGLAISRQLVEMMGGRIWVDSQPSVGSTFSFEIEVRAAADHTEPEHQATPALQGMRAPPTADLQALRPVQGARLLLVEDNAINQQVASEILQQAGFVVEVADDGAQALSMLQTQAYDAVLMDIQMPVMDGYTAAARIREQPRWKDLPVLAMTANVMGEDRAKAAQAGMDDHIAKPIVAQDLFAKLLRWIPHGHRPLPEGFGLPAPAPEGLALDLPSALPGMDLSLALRRVADNRALLRKLLVEFAQEHGDDVQKLKVALQEGDLNRAQRLAHTLKGVGGTIGAADVQQHAGSLEAALRGGRRDEWDRWLAELSQAFEPVRDGLRSWMAQVGAQAAAPVPSAGQRLTPQALIELLEALERKLRDRDPEAADLAQTLARHCGPSDADAVTLQQQAHDFEFDAARHTLRTLQSRLGH